MNESRNWPGKSISIVLQILFWVTAYFVIWQGEPGPFHGTYPELIPLLFLLGQALLVYHNIYVLIPRILIARNVWLYLGAVLVCMVIIQTGMYFLLNPTMGPVSLEISAEWPDGSTTKLVRDPERVRMGMATMTTFLFLFFSSIFGLGREFVKRERERNKLERAQLESEMKFLRSQINPHFLFNVMNNLYATVKLQPDKAGELISRISDMLRYVIYDCSKPRVRIGKEVEYLRNYVYFQELKDPGRMKIAVEIEVQDEGFTLEPMLLLPFVENAFKHSYSDEAEEIFVDVKLQADRERMRFICSNSLPPEVAPLTADPAHAGIGIANVRSRLDISHPGKYQLDIRKTAEKYTVTLDLEQ